VDAQLHPEVGDAEPGVRGERQRLAVVVERGVDAIAVRGEVVVVEGTQKVISGRAVRVIERAPLPQPLTAAAP